MLDFFPELVEPLLEQVIPICVQHLSDLTFKDQRTLPIVPLMNLATSKSGAVQIMLHGAVPSLMNALSDPSLTFQVVATLTLLACTVHFNANTFQHKRDFGQLRL
eukprot:Lithocolla_globosa_v1_NODE_1746_length_2364_cov_123.437419.p2 type:complete len:105 gc:universal NODE_1746_length_2364_cov_123.437419:1779-2093(+)